MKNFVNIASEGFRLYADIDGYDCPSRFFRSSRPQDPDADKYRPRPDIAIQKRNKTTTIGLTCHFEKNLEKSRDYKKARYKNLGSPLLSPRAHFNLILPENSSSGFPRSTKSFEQFLKSKDLDAKIEIRKCQEVVLRASYFVYCRQNKTWSEPDLISFTQFFFCFFCFFVFSSPFYNLHSYVTFLVCSKRPIIYFSELLRIVIILVYTLSQIN